MPWLYTDKLGAQISFLLSVSTVFSSSALSEWVFIESRDSWNRLRLRSSANIGKASTFTHSAVLFFFNFWSLKPWIRIGLQPQTLDPDPDQMNADPKPCYKDRANVYCGLLLGHICESNSSYICSEFSIFLEPFYLYFPSQIMWRFSSRPPFFSGKSGIFWWRVESGFGNE